MFLRLTRRELVLRGEPSAGVATKPSVAIETQTGTTSSVVSSFFKAKLQAIKEKQGQQDLKQDKILTQLTNIEELLYFALIMLKRMSPSKASNPHIPTLAATVGTLAQTPATEPNEFLSALVQPYVFRIKEKGVSSEGDPSASVAIKLSVATETQIRNTSSAVSSLFRLEL